jgi:glutathione S-transferase
MLNKTLDVAYYMRESTKIATEDPMELFFAPLACSMSARIALAEAGAAINLVEVDTHAGRIAATGEDYRAINPLGYVPALRLDDGTVLTENSAILQYIADQYPEAQLAPPASDRVGRAKLRQWLSFIGAELHKSPMTPLLGDKTPPEVKAWTLNRYAPRLAYLDAKLKDREFLLDRFSVADGYLAVVLNWTRATPQIDLSAYPNVKAYLERMRARPSIAAALATEIPLFHAEVSRRKAA